MAGAFALYAGKQGANAGEENRPASPARGRQARNDNWGCLFVGVDDLDVVVVEEIAGGVVKRCHG